MLNKLNLFGRSLLSILTTLPAAICRSILAGLCALFLCRVALAYDIREDRSSSTVVVTIGNVRVRLLAGDVTKLRDVEAIGFPGSRTQSGLELVVGYTLEESFPKTMKEIDDLVRNGNFAIFENQFAPIVHDPSSGRLKYLVNVSTQDYSRTNLFTQADPESQQLADHTHEMEHISRTLSRLTQQMQENRIKSIGVPFFGTGSFHGMNPFLALTAMLAGIASYRGDAPLEMTIVYYWRSPPQSLISSFFNTDNVRKLDFLRRLEPVLKLNMFRGGIAEDGRYLNLLKAWRGSPNIKSEVQNFLSAAARDGDYSRPFTALVCEDVLGD